MIVVREKLSRLFEDEFDSSVLGSLLVLSTKDTEHKINTVKERILRSAANSLLSYVKSDKKISQYSGEDYSYERYVASVISSNKDRMDILEPELRESFGRLFKANRMEYALGEMGTTIGLYRHIPEFIRISFDPIISLPNYFVSSVENNRTFSEKEETQLKEIASRMAPLIKEENDFVKYNYH